MLYTDEARGVCKREKKALCESERWTNFFLFLLASSTETETTWKLKTKQGVLGRFSKLPMLNEIQANSLIEK
jgi:hypothetical protein